MCRSSGGTASARAVEAEPAEPEEEREIQHVWALSVCDISGLPLDASSVCDNSDIPSGESGQLLNMILDPGAEEHVVPLADWKSLSEPLLKPGYSIEMKPTQSVLPRSGGGCILRQRCGKHDFLSIRVRRSREINAITFSTMKREVQSLKSESRALRTGHLSTSEVRLPSIPEEKHRHEVNGRTEYDNRCEICVKSSGISRHPRRLYSESCAFDHASVTFKD